MNANILMMRIRHLLSKRTTGKAYLLDTRQCLGIDENRQSIRTETRRKHYAARRRCSLIVTMMQGNKQKCRKR